MPRWLFQLEGGSFDLEDLASLFPDGPICVVQEQSAFYLAGSAFDPTRPVEATHPQAVSALDELTAVATLLQPAFRRPSIGPIHLEQDDGTRRGFHIGAGTVMIRARLAGNASVDPITMEPARPRPTRGQELLLAAKRAPRLYTALLLGLGVNTSWPRLFRISEEIELALQMTADAAGLCSSSERDRFRRTANTAEVAGPDARHAEGRFTPPPNPMTLAEAQDFVRALLQSALDRVS
jgi:hypothetical protein